MRKRAIMARGQVPSPLSRTRRDTDESLAVGHHLSWRERNSQRREEPVLLAIFSLCCPLDGFQNSSRRSVRIPPHLAFPNAHHVPAESPEKSRSPAIPLAVPLDLRDPIPRIPAGR